MRRKYTLTLSNLPEKLSLLSFKQDIAKVNQLSAYGVKHNWTYETFLERIPSLRPTAGKPIVPANLRPL